ncbi:hypothetical protein RW1_031_01450 [Rhodococcus wratislaviensis NBRC 100605]|uniref:Uncharacterized protein n=1 Tax=Rhodococcus wratislaviensis NBRC 100605 TaxID=1219028 RepID=X0R6J0_RHOWR|nr:hypothetical protein RW1_031_01450 [Rhodococcus wratislaviensis NBRC 100605]
MTTAWPTVVAADAVLAGYLDHVATLGLSGRAVRGRTRIATAFLAVHPDLREWMARPASDRLTELRSTGAWPLLCHLIGRDELRLDLEFAAVKNLTGLGSAIEARDPDGFAAGRRAGLALGWTPSWVETVLGECLAVLLAWHGGLASGITNDTVDDFDAALAATQSIPPSSRRAYRNRLAGLRQVLFEASSTFHHDAASGPAATPNGSPTFRWQTRSARRCCGMSPSEPPCFARNPSNH